MPAWLYRLLLRAYPAAFRARYGQDLLEALVFLRRQAAGRNRLGRLAFWSRTALDTIRSGLSERLSTRGYRLGRGGVRLPARGPAALLQEWVTDLGHATRSLRNSPAYVTGVTLTLALGIGATTALFSTAWGVLGKPLPFAEGEELVRISSVRPGWSEGMPGSREIPLSVPEMEDLKSVPAFEEVAEHHNMTFNLIGPDGPDLINAAVVSSNTFDFLGMEPLLGRLFDPVEDTLGAHPVIVLTHDYWREAFEGDPEVVGSSVRMNGADHEIVGVLPPIPQFPRVSDVYLPLSMCPTRSDSVFMADRSGRLLTVFGRLDEATTLKEGRAALEAAEVSMHDAHPSYGEMPGGHRLEMASLREELVARARPVMRPLLAVSGLLFLVACANAAGLALIRASRRMEALTVQAALGAGRRRLARQLLAESTLLGLLGGALGVGIALLGSEMLATFAAEFTPRAQEIQVDRTVLAFALGTSLLSGVVFGTAPALLTSRVLGGLARVGRSTAGRQTRRMQKVLVAGQVTLAFGVVAGAGLLLRSFWEANSLPMGIDTESVVTAEFAGGWNRYPTGMEMRGLLDEVRHELAGRPEFLSVARLPWAPLAAPHVHRDGYYLKGMDGEWHAAVGDARGLDPEYFETMGISLVAGRTFQAGDTLGAPRVVVVNETFYERYMAGLVELGAEARACPPELPCETSSRIVGVVEDARINGPEYEVSPEAYLPLGQTDWSVNVLVARVTGSPEEALETLVGAVHARDPELAVRHAGSLEQFRRDRVAPRRFMAGLLLSFALVAVALALSGVFGVTALAVAARKHEISVRRALGATEGEAEALVLKEGLGVIGAGLLGGLALTLGTSRFLEGLLFQVQPTDPLVLGGAVVVFVIAATVACAVPARRITRFRVLDTLSTN